MKFLSTLMLLLTITATCAAQNSLNEQKAKLVRSEMNVELREQAIEMMNMNSDD